MVELEDIVGVIVLSAIVIAILIERRTKFLLCTVKSELLVLAYGEGRRSPYEYPQPRECQCKPQSQQSSMFPASFTRGFVDVMEEQGEVAIRYMYHT